MSSLKPIGPSPDLEEMVLAIAKSLLLTNPPMAARLTRFREEQVHDVAVDPDEHGRPGERVRAYSKAMFPPRLSSDGARVDFRVMLGPGGSSLGAVCLGRVSDLGTPAESARHTIAALDWPTQDVFADPVMGEDCVRFRIERGPRSQTEWKFTHRGWLYVAGVLVREGDIEPEMVARGRRVLSSWEWIDPEPLRGSFEVTAGD